MKIQFSKESAMPAVKLGASRQVAIPKKIHDQRKLIFTPKALIDKRLEEGLEDLKKGRVYGPFDSAGEMMKSLRKKTSAKR
jgi:hypothetical protein